MKTHEAIGILKEQKYFLTKNVYKSTNETDREWELTKALNMAIEALQQEPKRGKWLNYLKEGLKWKCSECGSKYTTPWHYCPNCGARM